MLNILKSIIHTTQGAKQQPFSYKPGNRNVTQPTQQSMWSEVSLFHHLQYMEAKGGEVKENAMYEWLYWALCISTQARIHAHVKAPWEWNCALHTTSTIHSLAFSNTQVATSQNGCLALHPPVSYSLHLASLLCIYITPCSCLSLKNQTERKKKGLWEVVDKK